MHVAKGHVNQANGLLLPTITENCLVQCITQQQLSFSSATLCEGVQVYTEQTQFFHVSHTSLCPSEIHQICSGLSVKAILVTPSSYPSKLSCPYTYFQSASSPPTSRP